MPAKLVLRDDKWDLLHEMCATLSTLLKKSYSAVPGMSQKESNDFFEKGRTILRKSESLTPSSDDDEILASSQAMNDWCLELNRHLPQAVREIQVLN